jgi:DNA repair protein RadC
MGSEADNPNNQKAREEPHYHGHRERLRERFRDAGPDALSDYELLEMALFAALPRRDTKPIAKLLLKKFGSFAEVVHAPESLLREIDGIGDASITQLKLLAAAASRIAKGEIKRSVALSSWNDVIDYCRTGMVSEDNIVFARLGTKVSNSDDWPRTPNTESICSKASILLSRHFSGRTAPYIIWRGAHFAVRKRSTA